MEFCWLYITARDRRQGRKLGRALVEARLAACANVIAGVESFYWWEGRLAADNEVVVIAKTRADLVQAAVERIKAVHSYSVPCVVALPIVAGNPDFLAWLARETARPRAGRPPRCR